MRAFYPDATDLEAARERFEPFQNLSAHYLLTGARLAVRMNVREATAADEPTLLAFTEAIFAENWDRPWRPPEVTPRMFEGKLVLLAEDDGEPAGYAFGDVDPPGTRT